MFKPAYLALLTSAAVDISSTPAAGRCKWTFDGTVENRLIVFFDRYFDSVVARERRRSIRLRTNTGGFDVTKNEFRCPLCSRLCNAAIPFFPTVIQKE